MLRREGGNFHYDDREVPEVTRQLEREGHALIRDFLTPEQVVGLRAAVQRVFDEVPADKMERFQPTADRYLAETPPELQNRSYPSERRCEMYRYQMFNRSAECQAFVGHPHLREVLEPLLGADFHVINNTAWRNPPGAMTEEDEPDYWHTDSGPHVPRPPGVPWPDAIPYPIFVVGTHVYLEDCRREDGPTTVVPGTHRSGQGPPEDRRFEADLSHEGRLNILQEARAGDLSFFVSDVWHRRYPPAPSSRGRFFLQTNFGRRDIAQRIRTPDQLNHIAPAAAARMHNQIDRWLLGLHDPNYYDG